MHDAGWLPETLDGWIPPLPACDVPDAALPFAALLWLTVASGVGLALALCLVLALVCGMGSLCARRRGFVQMKTAPSENHAAVELSESVDPNRNVPPVRSRIVDMPADDGFKPI